MQAPLLDIVHATVIKGGRNALDDVSLTIERRQHTAIIGPNGAGKSTLINLLTLVDRPLAAPDRPPAVRVCGRDLWNVSDLRQKLGIVSADLQHRFVMGNLAGTITACDAVLSGLMATYGWVTEADVTDAMREHARSALMQLGVQHLSDVAMGEMSTGEARRVLIARALVNRPDVLVLDEPTAGLDLVARRRLLETMSELARAGTTVVTVTHRLEEIIPEVSHVVLLRRGRVDAAGPRSTILTSVHLSRVFEAPVALAENDGFLSAAVGGTLSGQG
jgi:iron complex transport system ATP-binding protein